MESRCLSLLAFVAVASISAVQALTLVDPTRPGLECGPVCLIFCPNGNVLDARGCPTCQCKPDTEPVFPNCGPVCFIACEFGNVLDARGCPTCSCNPAPRTVCPLVKCANACPNGFKKDNNGCQTCTCNAYNPVCSGRLCKRFCPNGFLSDPNGCPICQCKPLQEPQPYGLCDLRCAAYCVTRRWRSRPTDCSCNC